MQLSIVIVNWNSAQYLRSCLTSLFQETSGINFEVLVIDNASFDGSAGMVASEFPAVKFIQSHQNLGFARANNLGALQSRGDLLLFLNPDTEVVGNAIEELVRCLSEHPSAGALGARLLNTDGTLQTSAVQPFPTILNQALDFEALRKAFPRWRLWGTAAFFTEGSTPAKVETISGACFMIRRDVFQKVGQFSEEYFMYSDDLDLSYKVKRAGYLVIFRNDCCVIHHGGKSSELREDNFADVLQRQSLASFFKRTRGETYCLAYRVSTAIIAMARLTIVACGSIVGGIGLRGETPKRVMRKWSKILGWALGFSVLHPEASRSN